MRLFYIKSLVFLAVSVSFMSKAQLTTSTALSPEELVKNVLLGSGIKASNITYSGNDLARGTFDSKNANVGLSNGILLSSGKIEFAIGPNNQTGKGYNYHNLQPNPKPYNGDKDLDILSKKTTFDAAILEFDFVPIADTLKFRYVFASEEYPEYVCSNYNDVFAFFVTGPDPAGGNYNKFNIAQIPNSLQAVTINNVNKGKNNSPSEACPANNSTYYTINGIGNDDPYKSDSKYIQYDGLTVPLTAKVAVVCGQTYHIKIAIADAGDGALDSGVFLEGGSFSSSGGEVKLSTSINFSEIFIPGDSIAYEACNPAVINVDRGIKNLDKADTLDLVISGTAINGLDYELIPDKLYFEIGQQFTTIPITTISDDIVEPLESVFLKVYITGKCLGIVDSVTAKLYISDYNDLKIDLGNDLSVSCPEVASTLKSKASGGIPTTYSYSWVNANGSLDSAIVNPSLTTKYFVTVNDACKGKATDSTTVKVLYTPMQMKFNNDTNICAGQSLPLSATVSNGVKNYSYEWVPNVSATNSAVVAPFENTSYTITATDGCSQSISKSVMVTTAGDVDIAEDTIFMCVGTPKNIVLAKNLVTSDRWYLNSYSNQISTSASILQLDTLPVGAFIYYIVGDIGNPASCSDTDTVVVVVQAIPTAEIVVSEPITIQNALPIFCAKSTLILNLNKTLTAGENVSWYLNDTNSVPISTNKTLSTNNLVSDGQIILKTTNKSGCYKLDTTKFTVKPLPDTASTVFVSTTNSIVPNSVCSLDSSTFTINFLNPTSFSTQYNIVDATTGTYLSPLVSANLDGKAFLTFAPNATTKVTIIAQDFQTACSIAFNDTMTITVHPLPIADAGLDTIACKKATYTIAASASNGTPNYSYLFSKTNEKPFLISPDTLPNKLNVLIDSDTIFYLQVTDASGCKSIDSIAIKMYPVPQAKLSLKLDSVCLNVGSYNVSPTIATITHKTMDGVWTTTGFGTITNPNTLNPNYNLGGNDTLKLADLIYTPVDSIRCGKNAVTIPDTLQLKVKPEAYFSELVLNSAFISSTKDVRFSNDTLYVQQGMKNILIESNMYNSDGVIWKTSNPIGILNPMEKNGNQVSVNYIFDQNDKLFAPFFITAQATSECNKFKLDTIHIVFNKVDVLINTFTPNGDGVNDVFRIAGYAEGGELIILDRWGLKVYESKNYKNDWAGELLEDDTYFYIFTFNGRTQTGYVRILAEK